MPVHATYVSPLLRALHPVAALLQCCLEQKRGAEGARWEGNPGEWSSGEAVVSLAGVSRQCDAIMKACVGLRWGAEVDVTRWVREMEKLKVILNLPPRVRDACRLTNREERFRLLMVSWETVIHSGGRTQWWSRF